MAVPRRRRLLRLSLNSLWAAPVALALLAGGWLAGIAAPTERDSIIGRWRTQLVATADDRAAAIDSWLTERIGDAQVLSDASAVIDLVAAANRSAGPRTTAASAKSRVSDRLDAVVRVYGYRGAAILDGRLAPVATAAVDWVSDPACLDLPRRALAAGRVLVDFHLHLGATPVIQIAAPVDVPPDSRPVGVVVLVMDPRAWLYPFLEHRAVLSNTAETLLLRRDGRDALFLSPLRHRSSAPLTFRLPLDRTGLAGAAALNGRQGFAEYTDYRDEPVFAVTRPIRGAPWALVSKVDRAEALQPYLAWLRSSVVDLSLLVVALSGVLVGAWSMRRSMVLRAVADSERRFGELVWYANDAVFVCAQDGRILQTSQRAQQMYGYSEEELRGMRVSDLRAPAAPSGLSDLLDLAGEREALTVETVHRRRDGSEFPVEASIRRAAVRGEAYLVSAARDITARRQAEARIDRVNRFLRTISEVNELIVRERNVDRLLATTCRVLVEHGGFGMAWIGFVAEDTGRVVPTAAFGCGTDLLGAADGGEEGPLNLEPAATALRERRRVVMGDGAADPAPADWRAAGRARGFAAAAAFPVSGSGKTPGALVVYAAEPGRFDGETLALLEELADDVAFAIDARAGQERLKLAAESLSDVIFEWNLGSRMEWYGDVDRLLGYAPGEFPRTLEAWEQAVHPDDRARVWAGVKAHFERRAAFAVEYRVRFSDGGWRDWSARGEAVRDAAGVPRRMVGAITDVTARKAAERALRESEDTFRYFFDWSVVGKSLTRPDGTVRVNQAFADMLGYSLEELEHANWQGLTHPDDVAETARVLGLLTSGERDSVRFEKRYLHRDGSAVWADVSSRLRRDEQGRPVYLITTVTDISERKRAEAEMAALAARRRSLLDAIPDIVVELGTGGICTWANPAGLDFFGDDAVGRRPDEYVEGESELASAWQPLLDGRETTANLTVWQRRRDGQARQLSWWGRAVHGPGGRVVGLVATARDVTDIRQAAEQIRRLNAELEARVRERTTALEAANQELEAFAYSVSHDLRVPIRAIDGFSRLLMEEHSAGLDDEGHRLLGVVRQSAQRMGELIDDLLTFSRVGRAGMRTVMVDMRSMVNAAFLEVTGGDPGKVDFSLGPLPPVVGDPSMLRQVWVNLLANAVKFHRPGQQPRVEIEGRRENGEIVYTVRDYGVGFDMRYAHKLFGVFQRLHSQRQFPGTGVGLALVQRIVNRHGGRVWAEGSVGEGATFHVALPETPRREP